MVTAYVLITVELDAERVVLEELRSIIGVKETYQLYSIFDIVAKVEGDDTFHLKRTVLGIREVPEVRNTVTLVATNGCLMASFVREEKRPSPHATLTAGPIA